MYFGLGDKSSKSDQSQSHIRDTGDDSSQKQYSSQRSQNVPEHDVRQEVKAFQRQLQYDQMVKSGTSPIEAARRIGSNIPLGVGMTPKDIKGIIQTGKLQRNRI